MSSLKIGVHLVPLQSEPEVPTHSRQEVLLSDGRKMCTVEAELIDINPHFCRLRIARDRFSFDPADVRVQFAWTEVVARIIWTNTQDNFVELGLLMPEPGAAS